MHKLEDFDFAELAKREDNPRTKIRLLALANIKDGASIKETAQFVKVGRVAVGYWLKWFKRDGLQGISGKYVGRPQSINEEQLQLLKQYVLSKSVKSNGGRLTGEDIHCYLKTSFGIDYSLTHIYRLLKQLNISWITSRSRHPKQSQEVQDDFKKMPK